MNELEFWKIVENAHDLSGGDMDKKCAVIKTTVASLPKEDAIVFSSLFEAAMDKAYSWPLWAAAYIINGGCSDDSFSDFRASLISRGQEAFDRCMANPESLAADNFVEDAWFYEGYQYAVSDSVEAAAGFVPEREKPHPETPSGEEWSEDEVYDLFPVLSEKFA